MLLEQVLGDEDAEESPFSGLFGEKITMEIFLNEMFYSAEIKLANKNKNLFCFFNYLKTNHIVVNLFIENNLRFQKWFVVDALDFQILL